MNYQNISFYQIQKNIDNSQMFMDQQDYSSNVMLLKIYHDDIKNDLMWTNFWSMGGFSKSKQAKIKPNLEQGYYKLPATWTEGQK